MFEIKGKYNTARVYAQTYDNAAFSQVMRMCNMKRLCGSRIVMMPDMHAAEGCTVGTSMTVGDAINPSFVGSDIGCGMQVYRLASTDVDYSALDRCIRERIPSGGRIHASGVNEVFSLPLKELYCYDKADIGVVIRSFGTLGGGNHFIEMARSEGGELYLILHSGSRRLGREVADYHVSMAFFEENGIDASEAAKRRLRVSDIRSSVKEGDCFLSGENLRRYLADMTIAVEYAKKSREYMGEVIINALGLDVRESFTTVHNYIDTEAWVLRKGAVSAQKGEKLIIPINMRDGSLLCVGKGNEEWNFTAPHGSGRIMKRSEVRERVTLFEYEREMQGIFTTSVGESTLDESPMAYRRIEEIADVVEETAEISDILTPVYNFKASAEDADAMTADGKD